MTNIAEDRYINVVQWTEEGVGPIKVEVADIIDVSQFSAFTTLIRTVGGAELIITERLDEVEAKMKMSDEKVADYGLSIWDL